MHWEPRARKYSDSSSSGRSSEDSGVGSVIGYPIPIPLPNPPIQPTYCIDECHRSSPVEAVMRPPGDCVTSEGAIEDFLKYVDSLPSGLQSQSSAFASPSSHDSHYHAQNEQMTLPRIASDLNPNAPDFVFTRPNSRQIPDAPPSVHLLNYSVEKSLVPADPELLNPAPAASWSLGDVWPPRAANSKAVGAERKQRKLAERNFDNVGLLKLMHLQSLADHAHDNLQF